LHNVLVKFFPSYISQDGPRLRTLPEGELKELLTYLGKNISMLYGLPIIKFTNGTNGVVQSAKGQAYFVATDPQIQKLVPEYQNWVDTKDVSKNLDEQLTLADMQQIFTRIKCEHS
jgi:hypothetical protein